jgi:carbon-monoxide dehydrogenase medium subunit
MRAVKAEAILRGKKLDSALIGEAARAASEESAPISDVRSSKEYRREIVEVLTKRAIDHVLEQANKTF